VQEQQQHGLHDQVGGREVGGSGHAVGASAELRENQTDQDSLPPYELLDLLVEAYVERDCSPADLIRDGFDPDTVARVTRLIDLSEHKRRQTPPVLRVTEKAFGTGRRYPIASAPVAKL
jgi:NAD+ synthase (glutamine-hydrolysing)